MNTRQLMNPAHFFMEVGQESLQASNGSAILELPLERLAGGGLTDACKNNLTLQLQRFIDRKSWQPRSRVHCAIGARGVSLRRLTLPAASKEEVQRLLPFQIEREFPLSPDQLAWGALPLAGTKDRGNGKQDFLVAAVKKDSLEELTSLLARCGATPIFSLAALDRTYVCPQPPGPYAVLYLESKYSELVTIDGGVPGAVRVLPWGSENLSRAAKTLRGACGNALGGLIVPSGQGATFGGSGPPASESLEQLVGLINGQSLGRTIYVTGIPELEPGFDFPSQLASRLGNGVECRSVELSAGAAGSAAVQGMQRALDRNDGCPRLVLQLKSNNGKTQIAGQGALKWAGIAASLLLLGLLLPYAEALVLKSHLAGKLASIKNDQGRLATIDRELDFLQYLKENEPPYLDALMVLAKAAPPGTRFDSVSMNRRGDVSLRGALRDGQQVSDLRSKLIASGFFAGVGVEEQAPTPDRQKVNVRITAQWKPLASRTSPAVETARASTEPNPSANPVTSGPPPGLATPALLPTPPAHRPGRE